MSDETVEPFRDKIRRMFIPGRIDRKKKKVDPDLDIIDPLERFERAIKRDAEKANKEKKDSSNG